MGEWCKLFNNLVMGECGKLFNNLVMGEWGSLLHTVGYKVYGRHTGKMFNNVVVDMGKIFLWKVIHVYCMMVLKVHYASEMFFFYFSTTVIFGILL
jgi:hypothetical protein